MLGRLQLHSAIFAGFSPFLAPDAFPREDEGNPGRLG
jgi:hypothetical protein